MSEAHAVTEIGQATATSVFRSSGIHIHAEEGDHGDATYCHRGGC
ncbi:hypothetical protein ACWGJT_31470 [Streptomyces xantholiticus]